MLSGKRLIVRAIEFANVKPTPNMYSTPGSRMPSTPAPSSVSASAAAPPMAIDDVPDADEPADTEPSDDAAIHVGADAAAEHDQREAQPVLSRREPEKILKHERRVRDQRHDADEAQAPCTPCSPRPAGRAGSRRTPRCAAADDSSRFRSALRTVASATAKHSVPAAACTQKIVGQWPNEAIWPPTSGASTGDKNVTIAIQLQDPRSLLAAPAVEDDGAREHAARRCTEPLQEPPQHERREAVRERRHDAGDDVDREPRREHGLAAVLIRQRSVDQRAEPTDRAAACST